MAERWQTAADYARKRLLAEGWEPDRVDDALQEALCALLERGTLNRATCYTLYKVAHSKAVDAYRRDKKYISLDERLSGLLESEG